MALPTHFLNSPRPHGWGMTGKAHGSVQFRGKANVKYKAMVGEPQGTQTGLLFLAS